MATKIPYRLQTDEHKHYHAPAGEKIEIRHRAEMDINGRRKLIPDVKINIWDIIQSHAEECEIENIVRRALNGDPFALNKKVGNFMDLTEMPRTIAEAQQLVINLKEQFEKLPADIKQKFDNNAEIFVASYGSEDWADKTGALRRLKEAEEIKQKEIAFRQNYEKAIENLAKEVTPNE